MCKECRRSVVVLVGLVSRAILTLFFPSHVYLQPTAFSPNPIQQRPTAFSPNPIQKQPVQMLQQPVQMLKQPVQQSMMVQQQMPMLQQPVNVVMQEQPVKMITVPRVETKIEYITKEVPVEVEKIVTKEVRYVLIIIPHRLQKVAQFLSFAKVTHGLHAWFPRFMRFLCCRKRMTWLMSRAANASCRSRFPGSSRFPRSSTWTSL